MESKLIAPEADVQGIQKSKDIGMAIYTYSPMESMVSWVEVVVSVCKRGVVMGELVELPSSVPS
jgi:hypothetical protein